MARNDGASVDVKKSAKQEDLPGVEPSKRKDAQLEALGDELIEWEDKQKEIKYRKEEAEENLIAAMRRKNKPYYSRQTWGSIILREAATKVKVKKETVGEPDEDEDSEEES